MRLPPSVPDLESLDLLVSVIEVGSISRAAAMHGISQPSASMRLSSLERRLGLKLLERTTAGTRPTEAGERMFELALEVVQAASEFDRTARSVVTAVKQRLRVVTNAVIGEYVLPKWLHALTPEFSDVAISVSNSTDTVAHLVRGQADLGFAAYNDTALKPPLETALVGYDQLVYVIPAKWSSPEEIQPMTSEQLAKKRLIVRAARPGMLSVRAHVDTILAPYRADPPPEPLLELGSTNAIRGAVLDGVGPAILSRLAVAEHLDRGQLLEVPVPDLDLRRRLYALWPRDKPLSVVARKVVNIARYRLSLSSADVRTSEEPGI